MFYLPEYDGHLMMIWITCSQNIYAGFKYKFKFMRCENKQISKYELEEEKNIHRWSIEIIQKKTTKWHLKQRGGNLVLIFQHHYRNFFFYKNKE